MPRPLIASAAERPEASISASTSRPRLVSSLPARTLPISSASALGRSGILRDVDLLLVERAQHVLLHPVAGHLAVAAGVGQLDVVVDQRPALVHQHVAVVGRDAVGLFEPRAERGGQLAQRRADLLDFARR